MVASISKNKMKRDKSGRFALITYLTSLNKKQLLKILKITIRDLDAESKRSLIGALKITKKKYGSNW
jgi:hypothetical protein